MNRKTLLIQLLGIVTVVTLLIGADLIAFNTSPADAQYETATPTQDPNVFVDPCPSGCPTSPPPNATPSPTSTAAQVIVPTLTPINSPIPTATPVYYWENGKCRNSDIPVYDTGHHVDNIGLEHNFAIKYWIDGDHVEVESVLTDDNMIAWNSTTAPNLINVSIETSVNINGTNPSWHTQDWYGDTVLNIYLTGSIGLYETANSPIHVYNVHCHILVGFDYLGNMFNSESWIRPWDGVHPFADFQIDLNGPSGIPNEAPTPTATPDPALNGSLSLEIWENGASLGLSDDQVIGSSEGFKVRFLDQNSQPLEGYTVKLIRKGAHPEEMVGITNAYGTAWFAYVAWTPGVDTVKASVDLGEWVVINSNEVTVTWIE